MGVTGIGGVFIRARDPEALRVWYAANLGLGAGPYGQWDTQGGPSLFLPVAGDPLPADRPWMLNLRVEDLDGLVARLRAAGIEVATDPAWDSPGVGRFARLQDPEGNPLELWEPDAAS